MTLLSAVPSKLFAKFAKKEPDRQICSGYSQLAMNGLVLRAVLKRPQVIETWAFPMIRYALITAKTQVKIYFVQYLNFN